MTPGKRSVGDRIVERLRGFTAACEAGAVKDKFTIRTIKLDIQPRPYRADDVRRLRDQLGLSQGVFAKVLAVSVKTVRSWEQGLSEPSPMACRLLEEIASSPEQWRSWLRRLAAKHG